MSLRIQFATGLGQRLQEERKRLGLTQVQLADLLGVSRRTILNHETEVHPVPLEILNRLDQIGADCFYLLYGRRFAELSIPLDTKLLERVLDQAKAQHLDQNGKKISHSRLAEFIAKTYGTFAGREEKPAH